MSKWSGKQVVGLGGGIEAGKAYVVKLLQHLGALTIDADEIARRVILRGAPGYGPVVERFGREILDQTGQIDRIGLSRLLQANPPARGVLRSILGPLIREATASLIKRSNRSVVVVTASNLGRFELLELCDHVWVVTLPEEVQVANLVRSRKWSVVQARQFVHRRSQLDDQLACAEVAFETSGSREDLRRQVVTAFQRLPVQPDAGVTGPERQSAPPEPVLDALPARLRPTGTASILPSRTGMRGEETAPATQMDQPGFLNQTIKGVGSVGRRIFNMLVTLLVIAYLTSWGLILAERGREHLPAQPLQAAWQALVRVGQYLVNHPLTYYIHKENIPALQVVIETLQASAGLLLLALGVALLLGLPLGIAAALAKRKVSSSLILLISTLGISTPSFLVAMILWVVNIWVHRTFDIKVLPSAGFGWDTHLIMPVLVLSMRPLAQIAQVTYVAMRDILAQDYIRTAHSKGLSWRLVRNVHALPNILIPTLTTLGSSLRFSLASLPVVEVFFDWPGVGLMLLDAIQQGDAVLVTDLILALGLFFLLVNLVIEFSFPLIDARLRSDADQEGRTEKKTLLDWLRELGGSFSSWWENLTRRLTSRTSELPPLPSGLKLLPSAVDQPEGKRVRWLWRNFIRNPAFMLGSVMLLALLVLILFGENFTTANPYQIHGVMMVDGEIGAPPYEPSSVFPWGTDHIGRDIQALVLAGGKRTLTLAFFGMLARLLLGAFLGVVAGWQRDGWVDRLVSGAVGVWAAFPLTLYAMIIIQALGIQQGMWVFVVAISIVGWGEVAQFVRGQVITLKPQLFIESARSVGSRSAQILGRHVVPNLINSLIVLAALEMGGIMMLLAELGYLNIFMGGGFRAMLGEAGRMVPIIATYSDVPEWSALIANVRQHWRSYSWMALYPGLAVFISIMSFNLFGEGLRRFLDDTHANLSRLFNRYTVVVVTAIVAVIVFVIRASTPLSVYRSEGLKFDEERVMRDIQILSSTEMQGRETGMPGADLAAQYIAQRFAEIGIIPAGENQTYFQHLNQPRLHIFEEPSLAILDESGGTMEQLAYKRDFTEFARFGYSMGEVQAPVMGLALGPVLDPSLSDGYGISNSAAMDHVVIVRAKDAEKVNTRQVKGVLAVADETYTMEHRDVYSYRLTRFEDRRPYLLISPEVADRLLKTAGSSLAVLDAAREGLESGGMMLTESGTQVSISLQPRGFENFLEEDYINVLGVIPGQGYLMGTQEQIIFVSAYYDGLGTDLKGTVYPGANDNASGVAVMLELARLFKEGPYQPDKTVIFAAWAGGERQEGLSIVNVLNARPGASELTPEAVIELSGVGYGTGEAINLGNDSSYRLVKLFQEAAARYNLTTTTRGRNPHYGMPLPTAFGGREAMTLSISWDGSDSLAHTPHDTFEIIDPAKLYDIGRTTYLTLLVISRETDY